MGLEPGQVGAHGSFSACGIKEGHFICVVPFVGNGLDFGCASVKQAPEETSGDAWMTFWGHPFL